MEVTVKEAANKKSSLRFPSLPDKEIRSKEMQNIRNTTL